MTAREEILEALPRLRARLGRDDFTPVEMIDELRRAVSSRDGPTVGVKPCPKPKQPLTTSRASVG